MQFSILEMWQSMGLAPKLVAYILMIMSVYVVTILIERGIFYRKAKKKSILLVGQIRDLLDTEGSKGIAKAHELAQAHKGTPMAEVVGSAASAFMKHSNRSIDALDLVVGINRAVERSVERQTSRLKRGLGGLATIGATAPFVGLFGTVLGIINAFHQMAKTGTGGLATVSAGISEALIETAFGLLVAIPAVMLYNYFSNTVDQQVVDMDEVASEMVEAVVLDKGAK